MFRCCFAPVWLGWGYSFFTYFVLCSLLVQVLSVCNAADVGNTDWAWNLVPLWTYFLAVAARCIMCYKDNTVSLWTRVYAFCFLLLPLAASAFMLQEHLNVYRVTSYHYTWTAAAAPLITALGLLIVRGVILGFFSVSSGRQLGLDYIFFGDYLLYMQMVRKTDDTRLLRQLPTSEEHELAVLSH